MTTENNAIWTTIDQLRPAKVWWQWRTNKFDTVLATREQGGQLLLIKGPRPSRIGCVVTPQNVIVDQNARSYAQRQRVSVPGMLKIHRINRLGRYVDRTHLIAYRFCGRDDLSGLLVAASHSRNTGRFRDGDGKQIVSIPKLASLGGCEWRAGGYLNRGDVVYLLVEPVYHTLADLIPYKFRYRIYLFGAWGYRLAFKRTVYNDFRLFKHWWWSKPQFDYRYGDVWMPSYLEN